MPSDLRDASRRNPGGNDLVDALSINSGDFQEMEDEVMSEISDHTNFDPVNWFVEWLTDIF